MSQDDQHDDTKRLPFEREALHIKGRVEQLEREQAESKKRDEEYKELQIRLNRRLVIFTGALVICAVVTNSIYLYLAVAAKRSADAATAAVRVAEETLRSGNESFSQTLTGMKAQSTAMQDMANATSKSSNVAESALRASSARFKVDKRPYLVTETMRLKEKPALGKKLVGEIVWKNTGQTPAIQAAVYRVITVLQEEPTSQGQLAKLANQQRSRIEIGSGLSRATTVAGTDPIDPVWLQRIESRTHHVYIVGVAVYQDVFGDSHETYVCGRYEPASDDELFLWTCKGEHTNELR